jgi:hypothetical protein
MPISEMRRSGALSILGITGWGQQWKFTRLYFIKITRPDAILAKIAPETICRHAGDTKELVHLHGTNTDSRLHSQCILYTKWSPPPLVTIPEFNYPTSSICQLVIPFHIHLIPELNFSILMHLPRIASTGQILIQMPWLMKEHRLVSTPSVVW